MRSKITFIAAILAVFYAICVVPAFCIWGTEVETPFLSSFCLSPDWSLHFHRVVAICSAIIFLIGAEVGLVGYYSKKNPMCLVGMILYGIAALLIWSCANMVIMGCVLILCLPPIFGLIGLSEKRRWAAVVSAVLYFLIALIVWFLGEEIELEFNLLFTVTLIIAALLEWIACLNGMKWMTVSAICFGPMLFFLMLGGPWLLWFFGSFFAHSSIPHWGVLHAITIAIFVLGFKGYRRQFKKVKDEDEDLYWGEERY